MYQHILVALDFSRESGKVATKAKQLAELTGARLSLVHVVEYHNLAYASEFPVPEVMDLEQRMIDLAKTSLEKMAAQYGLQDASQHIESGPPKYAIRDLAQRLGVDLVLLGSHGRHGLQLLLGSTANGVLHLAPCDVLAVRVHD
jgi:universal stress protein A